MTPKELNLADMFNWLSGNYQAFLYVMMKINSSDK